MKLIGAILIYAVMALILGLGMILAIKGNLWLLLLGFLAYLVTFGRIGCLPH